MGVALTLTTRTLIITHDMCENLATSFAPRPRMSYICRVCDVVMAVLMTSRDEAYNLQTNGPLNGCSFCVLHRGVVVAGVTYAYAYAGGWWATAGLPMSV